MCAFANDTIIYANHQLPAVTERTGDILGMGQTLDMKFHPQSIDVKVDSKLKWIQYVTNTIARANCTLGVN